MNIEFSVLRKGLLVNIIFRLSCKDKRERWEILCCKGISSQKDLELRKFSLVIEEMIRRFIFWILCFV